MPTQSKVAIQWKSKWIKERCKTYALVVGLRLDGALVVDLGIDIKGDESVTVTPDVEIREDGQGLDSSDTRLCRVLQAGQEFVLCH